VDRRLGLPTAMLLVVASMVGTGVFTTTGFLLRDIGSIAAVLTSWALGGAVALFGALAYAELVAALPHNGGEYQLLSRIYHPGVGFAAGFTSLVVGFSAPTAASAIAFAEYADLSLGTDVLPALPVAIGLIVVTSTVHAVEVGVGGRFQNVFTAGKILLIAVFVTGGLMSGDLGRLGAETERAFAPALVSPAFAVGLIYVSFSYSGWNAAAYVAGEVREPKRNLPLALMLGTGAVTVLYLGLNFVFIGAADVPELVAAEERVGAVAAISLFGESAGRLLSAVIAIGLVSTVGALVMTGPRVYEAMGRDYPTIALLARRRAGGGPVLAIALQALISIVMVLTASFDELLTYIGFTLSFFAALTVLGVFVLRRREPELERPYRTWGHPFTSIGFVALSTWMVAFAVLERPLISLAGVGTIAFGAAVWWVLQRRRSR
jgi:APA family basic amino acid/polyamine antiporter